MIAIVTECVLKSKKLHNVKYNFTKVWGTMDETTGYTRVTDVLYPFTGLRLIDPVVLKNAADRGTRAHNACNAIMQDVYPLVDTEIEGYITSFRQWYDDTKEYTFPERFFCNDLMLTGECDVLYPEGDGFVLVDFKTPATESKTWPLQGSAYQYLAQECGYQINRIEFVKLDKKGKTPKVYVYDYNFLLYYSCYQAYQYFFKDKAVENYLDYL